MTWGEQKEAELLLRRLKFPGIYNCFQDYSARSRVIDAIHVLRAAKLPDKTICSIVSEVMHAAYLEYRRMAALPDPPRRKRLVPGARPRKLAPPLLDPMSSDAVLQTHAAIAAVIAGNGDAAGVIAGTGEARSQLSSP